MYAAYYTSARAAQQALSAITLRIPTEWEYDFADVQGSLHEAMAPAVATAAIKMNPGAAIRPATGAPTSPTSSAPVVPGSTAPAGTKPAPVDPKVAQAKKLANQAAIQAGVNKLKVPDAASTDMDMPVTADDTANNTKIATKIAPAMAGVLKNPAGADALTDLFKKYNITGP